MTKHALSILMLAISIAVVKPIANAEEVKASVPYDFVVAGKVLHAGTYRVSRASPFDGPSGALVLANVDGGNNAMFILPTTFASETSDKASLRFEQTAHAFLLTGIQTPSGVYTLAPELRDIKMALLGGAAAGK